jgi:hypothetical protein
MTPSNSAINGRSTPPASTPALRAAAATGLPGSPATIEATIRGVVPLLFHRFNGRPTSGIEVWSPDAPSSPPIDDLESYVYRDEDGHLAIPSNAIHGALVTAAKSNKTPRRTRASCMDIVRNGLIVAPHAIPFLPERRNWDFEDRRSVVERGARAMRVRPALREGWRLTFDMTVLPGEPITARLLHELLVRAGLAVGLCDFRPHFGRFVVEKLEPATGSTDVPADHAAPVN